MLGSAWYPEHWPEERWPADLKLMRQANMTVARIAEYSWSRLEPTDGQFDLDWLVRVVDLAQQHGVKIVLCTPVDVPPVWMCETYPEILRVNETGATEKPGGRRHFNPSSAKYRELSARVTQVLAEKFGKHPNVIGWQIGNEFCRYSYDAETRARFQDWLREQYGTLDELNRRWSTDYWSQRYSDWAQIHIPVGWQNPCLDLAFFRYQSEAFCQFQRVQIDAIRKHSTPAQWITHNIHGSEELDFVHIIRDADLASWDPYPGGGGKVDHLSLGWISDFCRTLRPRAHWVMETQPGLVNWSAPNLTLPRGAVRAMVWHYFGHGAEAVLFWQWRSALGGQEQYHGTLVAPDGAPRPVYHEVAQVGEEMARVQSLLSDTRTVAPVGLIYRYLDQAAIRKQRHAVEFDPHRHTLEFYGPVRAAGVEVDVVPGDHDLSTYPLVLAPHVHCLDDRLTQHLADYVRQGGHLVLGARSGFKDDINALLPSRQPGTVLAGLLGAQVDEFYTVNQPVDVRGALGAGQTGIWAETLSTHAPDAEVLLTYGPFNGWIDDRPAVVSRRAGKGRITYVGTWLDRPTMRRLIDWALQASGIARPAIVPPPSVEVCRRVHASGDAQREVLFLINHGNTPQQIPLPHPMTDALTGTAHDKAIPLAPYGVSVLSKT